MDSPFEVFLYIYDKNLITENPESLILFVSFMEMLNKYYKKLYLLLIEFEKPELKI